VSQENVEIVRRSLDAYSRRDIEALRTLNHPGLELDWSASQSPLAGVYRGLEEALRFYAEYYDVFEATVIEPDRFVETGDLVVVPNVAHQRGRDGIETTARSTLVFAVHNRQITRICLYQDEDHAFKAAGLEG
jgi:ketosteroid isomerase-like protein